MTATNSAFGSPNRSRTIFVLALILFAFSAGCGGYSMYEFISAYNAKSRFESQFSNQQPGNLSAHELQMMILGLSGIGPLGFDLATIGGIAEMDKCGWKYLSFALLLGFGGVLGIQFSRSKGVVSLKMDVGTP